MQEIWKDINGYEGIYQVSNLGNVRGLDRINANGQRVRGKMLTPCLNKDGYLKVGLCKNGKRATCTVHRLVALTFVPNKEKFPEINHKDEIKTNNCASNLEWCTNEYNLSYGTRLLRATAHQHRVKVIQKSANGELIKVWESTRAADKCGYNKSGIWACQNGKVSTYKGYRWEYAV